MAPHKLDDVMVELTQAVLHLSELAEQELAHPTVAPHPDRQSLGGILLDASRPLAATLQELSDALIWRAS